MNTISRTVLRIAAVAAMGTTFALAQANSVLTANIPFDFNAGRSTLPAGQYTISTDLTSRCLHIREVHDREQAIVITMPANAPSSADQSQLTFRVYGGKHYLASVWNGRMGTGRSLLKTSAEREAEMAGIQPTTAVLLARK